MLIAGADEAGRGCVFGPLVICICAIGREREGEIKKMGAKDSKLLSPSARSALYAKLKSICSFRTVRITAKELNELMKRMNLNEIEAMKIGRNLGGDVDIFYVDSPDPNPEKFASRIKKYYGGTAKIVSSNKAESKYPVVAAASICAKVERDAEIEKIKKILSFDFGSGYTSDPRTVDFLAKNISNEKVMGFVRSEWETVDRLRQRKLSEF
ncbi:MAG: ribonuclease HII [Candidatus Micrarchaeota archaeon]|nr:ribonuclease HII [Candidatus Micrarchaeota archaeon]